MYTHSALRKASAKFWNADTDFTRQSQSPPSFLSWEHDAGVSSSMRIYVKPEKVSSRDLVKYADQSMLDWSD